MSNVLEDRSVRALRRLCKLVAGLATCALAATAGCSAPGPATSLNELQAAPAVRATQTTRAIVTDSHSLRQLCIPLGPRLGLIEVRSPAQWRRLQGLAPSLGACPDLNRGTVVGIACWAGEPVDGSWPVRLDSVRVQRGGGLVDATFRGGTYLPDGAAYMETVYVAGLRDVLGVRVNGTLYRPSD